MELAVAEVAFPLVPIEGLGGDFVGSLEGVVGLGEEAFGDVAFWVAVADDLEDLFAIQARSVRAGGCFQMVRETAGGNESIATKGAGKRCAAVEAAISVLQPRLVSTLMRSVT